MLTHKAKSSVTANHVALSVAASRLFDLAAPSRLVGVNEVGSHLSLDRTATRRKRDVPKKMQIR